MNNCQLIGNLVRDPELRKTQNNNSVVSFTLAVRRDKETADFIDCIAWKGSAEIIAKYCKKGSKLGVSGGLRKRQYDDKNGTTHYVTEVLVNQVYLLDSRPKQEQVSLTGTVTDVMGFSGVQEVEITEEELPFY